MAQAHAAWSKIEPFVKADMGGSSPEIAFRIRYRDGEVTVTEVEAWRTLRRFLRPSELDRVVDERI